MAFLSTVFVFKNTFLYTKNTFLYFYIQRGVNAGGKEMSAGKLLNSIQCQLKG